MTDFPNLSTAVAAILSRRLGVVLEPALADRIGLDVLKSLSAPSASPSPYLASVISEYLLVKQAERCRPTTFATYRKTLRCFLAEVGNRPFGELTAARIAAFVHHSSNPNTRRSVWMAVHRFVLWAAAMSYGHRDLVPISSRPRQVVSQRGRIYTPAQAAAILRRTCATNEIGYWVLALFSGLRTIEIRRIQRHPSPWSLIRPEADLIEVSRDVAKARPRVIPMLPLLRSWLDWLRPRGIPFYPPYGLHKITLTRRVILGPARALAPRRNMARRSYISYRFGLPGASYAAIAAAAGNSEDTIRKYYRRPVTRAAAQAYFSLTPDHPAVLGSGS